MLEIENPPSSLIPAFMLGKIACLLNFAVFCLLIPTLEGFLRGFRGIAEVGTRRLSQTGSDFGCCFNNK